MTFFTIVLPKFILGRIYGKGPTIHAKVQRSFKTHDHHLTNRKIAESCAIFHVTVGKYLELAEHAAITWPLPDDIDDHQLEQRLYSNAARQISGKPAMQYLFQEMKKKHVTLQLLWYEYKQANPDGYQYSYFCELYNRWRKCLDVSLRQEYLAGEKLFIDYAGQTVPIFNSSNGQVEMEAQIFIATLGASNYSYAVACYQKKCLLTRTY